MSSRPPGWGSACPILWCWSAPRAWARLPSGPALLGTLQFAYVLAIEFARGPAAIGVAAATLAQLCILLPVAVVATLIFAYGSGGLLYAGGAGAASPTTRTSLK